MVLAAPQNLDVNPVLPSRVFYRPFDSWADRSEWTIHLPSYEEAIGVALGRTWVCLAALSLYSLYIHGYMNLSNLPRHCRFV